MGSTKDLKHNIIRPKGPLIPINLLDVAQQRLMVISLFIAIQAFKLYDLGILKAPASKLESPQMINTMLLVSFYDNRLNFLLKYIVIDSLFIWFVPILNISYLNFSKIVTMLQVVLMAILNFGLAKEVGIPLISSIVGLSMKALKIKAKEMTLLGDIVNTEEILDHSQYFKGRKIVKFAPDSLVELNPFENHWCIDGGVTVPIKFNTSSTGLSFLQLKHISLDDNSLEYVNFTTKSLKGMMTTAKKTYYNEMIGQDNIFYLDIPIKEPGYYAVNQVIDTNSMSLRLLNRHLIVPQCPSAKIFSTTPDLQEMCVDDMVNSDDLMVNVVGLPPLTFTFNEEVAGSVPPSPKQKHVQGDPKSPLANTARRLTSAEVKDVASWAGLRSFNLPLLESTKLHKAGDYVFSIASVEDALGNKIVYDDISSASSLLYKFTTHNLPRGALVDRFASRPLLENGSKKLQVQLSNIPCQQCDSPYVASFNHYDDANKFVKSFNETFDLSGNSRDLTISVAEPGFYELAQLSSRFCSTKSSSKVHVLMAPKPDLKMTAEPILDNCVGSTGYTFNFNIEGGTPPFKVDYTVRRGESKHRSIPQVKSLEAKTRVFTHDFKALHEGQYTVEFKRIKDKFYEEKFEKGEHKYTTYLRQRPTAALAKDHYSVCHGGSQSIPIHFEGKAPYTFSYHLSRNGKHIQSQKIVDVSDSDYILELEPFSEGGRYEIKFDGVQDSTSCKMEMPTNKAVFDVRNSVPSISFGKTQKVSVVESLSKHIETIPKGIHSGEINLKYKFTDPRGMESIENIPRFSYRDGFKIMKEGTYKLIDMSDAGCPGTVGDEETEVTYVPLPSIKLTSSPPEAVCPNTLSKFELALTGAPPFNIDYTVEAPGEYYESKLEASRGKDFSLKAETNKAGEYNYIIKDIYDSMYTKRVVDNLKRQKSYHFEKLEFRQTVWSTPQAVFTKFDSDGSNGNHNQKMTIQTCTYNVREMKALEPLPIKLSGEAPFNLKLMVVSKDGDFKKKFELSNIEESYIESFDIYHKFKLDIGTYSILLIEIQDAHGCINTNLREETHPLTLKINDVPKIRRAMNKYGGSNKIDLAAFSKYKINGGKKYDDYYCVGDHVNFDLDGFPPFNVGYKVDDNSHSVENLNTPYFRRLVTKPGKFALSTLSDASAKGCAVDLAKTALSNLEYEIFDLPSVELFQGNVIEEDIHQGEQAELLFTFKGVPPFKLTYTRTTDDDSGKNKSKKKTNKKVETKVVEGIEGYEYSIWTSAEGTYEAIKVEDSRCRVENVV